MFSATSAPRRPWGCTSCAGEAPDLGFGRQDPPGDAVRADPLLWWTGLAAPAREAVAEIDDLGLERVVDTPMGRRSVRDGLRFPAADLFLHAWDIAAATDVSVSIPDDAVPFVRALGDAVPPEVMRSPGVFGAEVSVPDGATAVDRLLGWTGRNPRWESPTQRTQRWSDSRTGEASAPSGWDRLSGRGSRARVASR